MKIRSVSPARIVLVGLVLFLIGAVFFVLRKDETVATAQREPAREASPEGKRLKDALRPLLEGQGIRFDDPLESNARASHVLRVSIDSQTEAALPGGFVRGMPADAAVSVAGSRTTEGTISLRRSIDLSREHIFVAMLDAEDQLVWFDLLPDPRIMRAEFGDEKGRLEGQTLYRTNAEMLVTVPAGRDVASLRFYIPEWDGERYTLRSLDSLAVDAQITKE